MISVKIENVTKRFGAAIALDRVSLQIGAGQIFFLLGPSGCGKTTLLRSIAGFYIPESGRILFGTEDVTQVPPHRRQTGMMFQSYALWPHLTVAENVAFGLEERKVARSEIQRRVSEALASVQMAALGGRRIHELSGGQQQRVALARALVIRPRCLLLDEPLSNLDTKLRLEMRGEIRRVCREFGLTAIYVTHDQKEALSIADQMAVMESGHLRQLGPPAEVYRRPISRFVADFMGETNFLPGKITDTSAGRVSIATEIGEFSSTLPLPPGMGVGAPALLSLRPETWTIGSSRTPQNCLAGRIVERVYLGETAQYEIATGPDGSVRLKIYELNPRFVDTAPDREVFLSIPPEDVVILPVENPA